jgi:phosphatidylglycerol:prolipoprotein diacylglycerol transferase
MIEFTNTAVSIFGFEIHYYGIIIMTGVFLSVLLATREAKRKGMDVEFLLDSVAWLLVAGIIGARLWHIFTPSPSLVAQGITVEYYLTHPLDAINIRKGGLGIPGAVIGGGLVFFWFCRWKKQSFASWVDVIAPAIPLGQAIGRWGNFVNQELYGAPTNLPWAIFIAPENRLAEFANFEYYHPIFLYESLWNLTAVFLLLWISRKFKDWLLPGDVFLMYLVSYPTIRILLDFLRLDASEIGGVNANQAFMAVVLVIALGLIWFRHRQTSERSNMIENP